MGESVRASIQSWNSSSEQERPTATTSQRLALVSIINSAININHFISLDTTCLFVVLLDNASPRSAEFSQDLQYSGSVRSTSTEVAFIQSCVQS